MVPLLKELISRSGEQGAKEVVIGMAHRGRLNVLVNVLGKNLRTYSTSLPVSMTALKAQVMLNITWVFRLITQRRGEMFT